MKAHLEKVHKGLRWECPICSELQVSKHSHERHYKNKHAGEAPLNADENMRYPNVIDRMPEKTKDKVIKGLKEKNEMLESSVKNIRKTLLAKMKENMDLKMRLELDIEEEKREYNILLEGIENESSEFHSENVKENEERDSENSDEEEKEHIANETIEENESLSDDDDDDDGKRKDPLNTSEESSNENFDEEKNEKNCESTAKYPGTNSDSHDTNDDPEESSSGL